MYALSVMWTCDIKHLRWTNPDSNLVLTFSAGWILGDLNVPIIRYNQFPTHTNLFTIHTVMHY